MSIDDYSDDYLDGETEEWDDEWRGDPWTSWQFAYYTEHGISRVKICAQCEWDAVVSFCLLTGNKMTKGRSLDATQ